MSRELALSPTDYEQVERVLIRLYQQVEASIVLLADISGQLLCEVQIKPEINGTILAALAASNMAATAEMGRLIGEADRFRTILHEGVHQSIHVAFIRDTFLLVVVFTPMVPIGLVRVFTRQAILQLTPLAESFESGIGNELGQDFGQALADELERSFVG